MSELQHYGVKGMKWGVIRNRIRTAAGNGLRKIVNVEELTPNESDFRAARSKNREASMQRVYQERSKMETKDLQKVVERLRLENELGRLAREAQGLTQTRELGQIKILGFNQKQITEFATSAARVAVSGAIFGPNAAMAELARATKSDGISRIYDYKLKREIDAKLKG